MTKPFEIDSREFLAAPATVPPPNFGRGAGASQAAADDDGWQDWPADDSDFPVVLPPIRQRSDVRIARVSIVAGFDGDDRPASTQEISIKAAVKQGAAHDPAVMLQRLALVAAAVALLTLAASAGAADAQENTDTQPTPGHITEAPVGHRQPHEWNLPRQVQRNEGHRTESQIDLDKQLQICRGCE
jgi:hypothetical protein